MSTTTNFKRIALVAVAALGLGVLSSVPSNAAISGAVSLTTTNSTTTTKALSDSTTAATATVKWLAGGNTDSVTISAVLKSYPSTADKPNLQAYFGDTSTSIAKLTTSGVSFTSGDSKTVSTHSTDAVALKYVPNEAGYVSVTTLLALDTAVARVAGSYVWTVVVTPYSNGGAAGTAVTADVTFTVAALDAESTTAAGANSTSIISTVSGGAWVSASSDATLSQPATATGSAIGAIRVTLKNASGAGSPGVKDSLTVTIDKGNVGTTSSAASGKSLLVNYPSGSSYVDIFVFGDGSAGTGNITIATKNAGTFTETLTYYGTDYASIVASSYRSVVATGSESTSTSSNSNKGAIKVNAYDKLSNSYGAATTVYAYSSDTTVVSNYGTACYWNSTDLASYCALNGLKAGTANITIRDAATVATSTVSSNAVSVRVSTGVASTFTLTTDKSSYAPGEKGYLIVTVKDAAGLVMPFADTGAYTTLFATGGISTTVNLGASSDTLTSTGAGMKFDRSSTPSSTDPIKVYTFYAPTSAGSFAFSAKGGAQMSAASQATATTVTATVADSASAALAAVSALAVTVASLKTLITTLTNLVLKIQKKVKA